MNILFLVMNFLMIFMFLNALVLKNVTSSTSQNTSACSYLASKLALQSKWERYKYQTYAKNIKNSTNPSQKKEKKTSYSKKEGTFLSHRNRKEVSSLGKWNLAPLFSSELYTSLFLRKLTEHLFIELYSHTAFWKEAEKEIPNLAEALLQDLSERREKRETLSDLFPQDERFHKMFYKMLKGSGSYDLTCKEGYPPLEDFCAFRSEDKTLTNFPLAPYPILKTLFQEAALQAIGSLEKKKWEKDHILRSLTKEELRSICLENSVRITGKQFQDIEPFLSFSHKKTALEKLTCKDKKTHVYLELLIPKQPN